MTRVGAVAAIREDVGPENLVQGLQHVADAQILDLTDGAREVAPEISQHVLVGKFVVRDEVELFLKVGREIVFDVAFEKAFEEGDDQPSLVLRNEPFLLDANVVAVYQHGHRRGVGRRPADAEFLHALDERCFGKARRRLRKVLIGADLFVLETIAGGQRRQAPVVFLALRIVFALFDVADAIVAAFLVDFEEAVEHAEPNRWLAIRKLCRRCP